MLRKKQKISIVKENELYTLPSQSEEMSIFVNKFRIDIMEHIVSSIQFAIDNKLNIVEVFQFKNSPFVVTILEKEFESNIAHIKKFYNDKKINELSPRVDQLFQIIKTQNDEKSKKETTDRSHGRNISDKGNSK